jgi:hypothetical protein
MQRSQKRSFEPEQFGARNETPGQLRRTTSTHSHGGAESIHRPPSTEPAKPSSVEHFMAMLERRRGLTREEMGDLVRRFESIPQDQMERLSTMYPHATKTLKNECMLKRSIERDDRHKDKDKD